jgi:polysaccharide biosynthesis/export protein
MRSLPVCARICAFAIALGSAGCGITPTSGPAGFTVSADSSDQVDSGTSLPYAFVKLDSKAIGVLSKNGSKLFNSFPDRRPPGDIRFGVGDIVTITIFEAAAGGLFIPAEAGVRPGNFITLPNQAVDTKGNIFVPYAGNIRADGRTQTEVEQAIVNSLKNRAIEPQVIVSLVDQRTSMISVLGDVNKPDRFPARAAPEHILDAIARAGGPKSQGFDTWVMLERNGRRAAVPFGSLVYAPANNIFVHPNDTIYLFRQPQTFLAFGATGKQGQYDFEAWQVSLAEAVGKAGGLAQDLAEPGSVFLYRGETRQVAEQLGINVTKFEGPIIPVIYNVNFHDPAGYFLATEFEIRNKDVLYIANSISVEATKFLNFVRTIVGTVNDPIVAANNAYALKAAINGAAPAVTSVSVTSP